VALVLVEVLVQELEQVQELQLGQGEALALVQEQVALVLELG
jgi:hypothetical protein